MMRALLAAALVPLALGDYSYSFTDAPMVNPYGPGAPYPSDIYTSVIRVRFRVHRRTRSSLSCFSAGRPRH